MQNKHDLHLIYNGNDHQVVKLTGDRTGIERTFASEMTHDVNFCRLIQKNEIVSFEVSIYGKSKREGDFKVVIEPAKMVREDLNISNSFILEPPCVWIGNPQRGIFKFMIKLENEQLLMLLDNDENWFSALYFPKSVKFYRIRMMLCRSVKSVLIQHLEEINPAEPLVKERFTRMYAAKNASPECHCRLRISK